MVIHLFLSNMACLVVDFVFHFLFMVNEELFVICAGEVHSRRAS
jgi:hypothetical protein